MIIWKYGNKAHLAVLVLLDTCAGLESLFMSLVSSHFILAATNRSMSIFTRTAIAGVLGFAIFAVLDYWRITVKNRYIRAINLRIKTRLIHKIIEQNAAEIDTDGALSLFTNDLKLLENNGIRNEVQLIQQVLIVVFAVIGGFYFDLPSTLVFAVGGVVPLLVSNKLHPRIVAKSKRWSQNNAAFTGSIKDTLLGIESIRNYFAQQISERRLVKDAADVEDTQNEMNATQGHVSVLTMFVALTFAFVLPFTFGIYRVVNGAITLATFMGVVQISNDIVNPLMSGLTAYNTIGTTKEIQARVNAMIKGIDDQLPAVPDINASHFAGLEMDHLTVARGDKPVLRDFDLKVEPGSKILIKGPSGVGKSTLLKTILGTVRPGAGHYELDGQDVTSGIPAELRQTFAYIRQQPTIFNESLRFNLTLGREFTTEKITAAMQQAGLGQLLAEKGLDYQVGEAGRNLSGGQAQRIEIARALLYGFPVLLADEISSALDEKLATQIHATIFASGKTVIEVAHHLDQATEAQFDQLVALHA